MSTVYPQLQFGAGRLWKVKDKFYEYYQCNRYHEDIYTGGSFWESRLSYLQEREKVGVIGIDGTGKSTLLKIARGHWRTGWWRTGDPCKPYRGALSAAKSGIWSGIVSDWYGCWRKVVRILSEEHQSKIKMQEIMQNMWNHWNLESDAKAMMTKLGITNFEQKAGGTLWGTAQTSCACGSTLVPCDVLILDEPTNHLDSPMADWLEDFLKKWRGALIMVTHDRYFLDWKCLQTGSWRWIKVPSTAMMRITPGIWNLKAEARGDAAGEWSGNARISCGKN